MNDSAVSGERGDVIVFGQRSGNAVRIILRSASGSSTYRVLKRSTVRCIAFINKGETAAFAEPFALPPPGHNDEVLAPPPRDTYSDRSDFVRTRDWPCAGEP